MEVIYYTEKVMKCMNSLDRITLARTLHLISLLQEYGYLLDMPDSKSLGRGLFELRTQGKVKVRVLYIFHKGKAYLIHAFIKKTWKINIRDISYTRKVHDEIIRFV